MTMRPLLLTTLTFFIGIGALNTPLSAAQTGGTLASDLLSTVQAIRASDATNIKGDDDDTPASDTDGDGVTDDVDLCPNTPIGESVDSDGCSASQNDPEASVKQVYEDDVNELIVSAAGGCTSSGCHGRAGAPGGLRLYSAGEDNNITLNYESFVRYIGSNSADKLMTKISGGSGHGGGTRYASDAAEFATIEAWAISVEALP
jgi:hypothetical protein